MLQEAVRHNRRVERPHVTRLPLLAAASAAAALLAAAGCGRVPVERVEWTTMGTIAAVQSRGAPAPLATDAARRAFGEVEKRLNAHDPESELSRLAPLADDEVLARCDVRMRPCYEAAFRLMRETDGAFNPRWRGPRTLDLGSIAKGFALDLACDAIASEKGEPHSSRDVLLDLGGNLKSAGGEWRVAVYCPPEAGPAPDAILLAPGEACATSAEYVRGKHIYDGRTGLAVTNDVLSVTVVHPTSAMLADGLSTVMFIFGREKGEAFLKRRYPEARAVWIMRGGCARADESQS